MSSVQAALLILALAAIVLLGLLVAQGRAPVRSPLLFGAGVALIVVKPAFFLFSALLLSAALAPIGTILSGLRVERRGKA
ncbi:hypothetical protein [Actinoplanes sp. NBRC 101535]|uniref:hypothetical protein n=1 Tax=Actinoplanes sp. NBRC 101535 TaxID=3032196 RepID=UPI0024A131FC|nr:hypothetical protein [Actinoplanes sp. NBRC 101535]GLY06697.1 hypothetical protein Acsp01_70760 [Actinoplanes sp. NBRC 101535]